MANSTPNYNLPLLDGTETVDVVNDVNALANAVDATIKNVRDAVETDVDGKAPIMHAVTTTDYGTGTANLYGHVKTSDDYTANIANGVALSSVGAYNLYGHFTNMWYFDETNAVRYPASDTANIVLTTTGESSLTAGSINCVPTNDGSFVKIYGWLDMNINNTVSDNNPATLTFKNLLRQPPSAEYKIDVAALYLGKDNSSSFICNIGSITVKPNGDVIADIWLSLTNGTIKFIMFPFIIANKDFGDTAEQSLKLAGF